MVTCKTSYQCLFNLHAGSYVWFLLYGPFLGTTAYYTIGSQLSKNIMKPLGPVVQKVDNTFWWIICYPADKCKQNILCYPPERDLSSGLCYLPFQQLGPDVPLQRAFMNWFNSIFIQFHLWVILKEEAWLRNKLILILLQTVIVLIHILRFERSTYLFKSSL